MSVSRLSATSDSALKKCFRSTRVARLLMHFACVAVNCTYQYAQQVPPQTKAPVSASAQSAAAPPEYVSFAVAVKKSVLELRTDCAQEGRVNSYLATGFFLYKADDRLGKGRGFIYIVTNRHAVQPGIEDGKPCNVLGYSVRLNRKPIPPEAAAQAVATLLPPTLPWVYPEDESVDLAMVPISIDQSKIDLSPIPTTILATSELIRTSKIAEGDSVLFAGLFIQMPGLQRLQPIVRQGTIAMMPDEAVSTTLKKPGTLYLVDAHVFGGNSGSPMFVNLDGFRGGSMGFGGGYRLLGIVSGYEQEDVRFNLQAATTYSGTAGGNSGVASVVPAEEVMRLVDSPALQKLRDAAIPSVPH